MTESPDAVLLYIPLMKELGMSWNEIKHTSHRELQGLLAATHEHQLLHSYDGYSNEDISEIAKKKPEIRSNYAKYLETRRKYEEKIGRKRKITFKGIN
tara:strand:- start:447 stop:740 length:294 start_codon:yes stop_codon:yes gene_type:complete